jgi:hypothetical protein
MSLRFRNRVQIDAKNNLYARDPQNTNNFIVVGNIQTPEVPDLPAEPLSATIRYRKGLRFDANDKLFIRDTTAPGAPFIQIGDFKGFSVPGAPTGLNGTPTDTTISVAFTAPVNNGNTAITTYEYSLDAGANWNAFNPATATSPGTITGLTPATQYGIIVRAVNSVGVGAASTSISVTTLP